MHHRRVPRGPVLVLPVERIEIDGHARAVTLDGEAVHSARRATGDERPVRLVGGLVLRALEALLVINRLNRTPPGTWVEPPAPGESPVYYWDVNGNGTIEARDALAVINYLNRGGSGEGESSGVQPLAAARGELAEGEAVPQLASSAASDGSPENIAYVGVASGETGLAIQQIAPSLVDHRISGYVSSGLGGSPGGPAQALAAERPAENAGDTRDPIDLSDIVRQSKEKEWDDLAETLSLGVGRPETVYDRIFQG